MEFKGIDKAVDNSHSVTVGNTKYSIVLLMRCSYVEYYKSVSYRYVIHFRNT